MSDRDDEFDDFLARRKPVFRRSTEDPFEPPEELDRIVLGRAREAIERERPERLYHGPRWGMPVALAASLLLVFSIVLHFGAQSHKAAVPEVTVQNISQDVRYLEAEQVPAPPAEAPAATPDAGGAPLTLAPSDSSARNLVITRPGGFASEAEGARHTPAAPAPAAQPGPAVASTAAPPWRHDAASWRAEIERLRTAGKAAEADAEQAEYNRQHRAYAGSPDR